jgi:F-type H+-transporting ATPase subunit delta
MQNQTLARRYATAVFRLAELAKAVDAVGNGLASATDVIYGSDDVRRFYLSPVFERKRKEALLLEAFEGKLHEVALHTLLLLVRKRREALLPAIVREFGKLALAASGREPLEILSARALSAGDVAAMVARLERSYGKHFAVAARVDPGLLGGVRITMGDRRIDGTLAGRFDQLARDLTTPADIAQ